MISIIIVTPSLRWLRGVYFCSGCDVPASASAAHLVAVFAKFRAKVLAWSVFETGLVFPIFIFIAAVGGRRA
jgi:hypothetical protein